MSNNFTTRTASLRATTASVRKLDTKEVSINGENIDSKYASLNASNSFTGNNIFNGSISVFNTADFATTIRKGGTSEDNEILNRAESDERYAQLEAENTFTANNTFEQEVQLENGATASNNINVESGNIIVNKEGVLTFSDPDGAVISSNGVSGYQYIELVPTSFTNGAIYELGLVEGSLNLSAIQFDGIEDKLVQTCEVWFKTGSTLPTITWPTGTYWIDKANGVAPTLIANMTYRIVFRNEIIRTVASVGYCYPTPTA